MEEQKKDEEKAKMTGAGTAHPTPIHPEPRFWVAWPQAKYSRINGLANPAMYSSVNTDPRKTPAIDPRKGLLGLI
jgi:hypothetical protein